MGDPTATLMTLSNLIKAPQFPWASFVENLGSKGLYKQDDTIASLNKTIISYDSNGFISSVEGKYGPSDVYSIRIELSWNQSESKGYMKLFKNSVEELRAVEYFVLTPVRKCVLECTCYKDTRNNCTISTNVKASTIDTLQATINFNSQQYAGDISLGGTSIPQFIKDLASAIDSFNNPVSIGALRSELISPLALDSYSSVFHKKILDSTYCMDKIMDAACDIIADLLMDMGFLGYIWSALVDALSDYIIERGRQ